nr:phosphoribosyltransferase family protein [Caenimonas aquaedulcis]
MHGLSPALPQQRSRDDGRRGLRVIPSQCAVCRAWPAQPVCEACISRFAQPSARCSRCALPVADGIRECGRCAGDHGALDACHAAVSYGYPWSNLVADFKFSGHAAWARAFALLMRSAPWFEPSLDAADLVLAMPLAPRRLARRGYNQSLLLARALAPAKADATLLVRVRETAEQAALDRRERLKNVQSAFAVDPMRVAQVRGRRIAIVDDVMTSGASMRAAALALRQAGARHVTGLVLARTDDPAA